MMNSRPRTARKIDMLPPVAYSKAKFTGAAIYRDIADSPTTDTTMLITHERNKLLNAIVYFASNTRNCGKTKLFKLLYLLDFEHFRMTGRSVTDQLYYAWRLGPVPVTLDEDLDNPPADLCDAVRIVSEQVIDHCRLTVIPQREFDPSHFSKRELRLLTDLAERYRSHTAQEMVDVTHTENGAWERVWADGAGRNALIPYEIAVSGEDSAMILALAREHEAIKEHYGDDA